MIFIFLCVKIYFSYFYLCVYVCVSECHMCVCVYIHRGQKRALELHLTSVYV